MQKERIAIFIDGSNLYHSLKKLNTKIDFQKLISILLGDRELVFANYYTSSLDIKENEEKYWKHQRFLEELEKIPKFKVILCKLKKIGTQYFIKGDDAKLIHDFIVGAYENLYDKAIIVSGDEDFEPMIKTAQKKNKLVGNAFFKSSSSNTLRNACNFSISLDKNINKIKIRGSQHCHKDHTGTFINNN
jgi:uncharacterized LabA/DUF88 family protein